MSLAALPDYQFPSHPQLHPQLLSILRDFKGFPERYLTRLEILIHVCQNDPFEKKSTKIRLLFGQFVFRLRAM